MKTRDIKIIVTNESNIYHREVLFEKEGNNHKSKLYHSIKISQKEGRITANAFWCLYQIVTEVLKRKQFNYISKQDLDDLRYYSIQSCSNGYKHYKDDGNYEKCYKYFLTLIYRGLYSTT